MNLTNNYLSPDEIADVIPDGALIGIPKEDGGASMALTRALIRTRAQNLRILTVPVSSIQADMLIGAGCVQEIETSAVSMGEFGFAPQFRQAVETGSIKIKEATCPAIYAELQAAEKGSPFIPLRGIIGSDILANRPDWKIIDNPLSKKKDPIVLLPAVQPEFALFHAEYGDFHGNVWVGARRECVLLAHASCRSFVTVEKIWEGNLMDDDRMRSGTIPPIYVEAVAHVPKGAWPLSLGKVYERDGDHLRKYVAAAQSLDNFNAYLQTYVFDYREMA
tara:strand:+ start:1349 stop:2179 length:831 start_codon:yes stop_codon:yes gene_type:complete